jgi:hypothetical protein
MLPFFLLSLKIDEGGVFYEVHSFNPPRPAVLIQGHDVCMMPFSIIEAEMSHIEVVCFLI